MPSVVCPLSIIDLRLLSTHLSPLLLFCRKYSSCSKRYAILSEFLSFCCGVVITLLTILGQWNHLYHCPNQIPSYMTVVPHPALNLFAA